MKIITAALFGILTTAVHAQERVPAFLVGDWSSSEPIMLRVRSNGMGEVWLGNADAMGIFLYDGHYVASKRVLSFHAGTMPLHFKYDSRTKTLKADQAEWKDMYPKCTRPLTRLSIQGPLPPITTPSR
ncbi:MAG TPA: hypothetical protein VK961_18745 [Chthoniobacter sp.]|nr:hypothetical protein [Chthoniobacter sp.]